MNHWDAGAAGRGADSEGNAQARYTAGSRAISTAFSRPTSTAAPIVAPFDETVTEAASRGVDRRFRAAEIRPRKSGWARFGRLLNSGWN